MNDLLRHIRVVRSGVFRFRGGDPRHSQFQSNAQQKMKSCLLQSRIDMDFGIRYKPQTIMFIYCNIGSQTAISNR